ncbi:MAG: gliding motility-associated C-terminal domain-containing protein [Lewinellaceae bacterium]|nr:gliding motility-associated C-terminal domain-containing protein [Lewinellaceae bacterium]
MNKKLLLPLAFIALFCTKSSAQVPGPCQNPPPPGAENCQSACVYCNFDGYMGTNNGTPSGGNTVCGQIALHNDQWFGFTAGSTSITITLIPSNCADGNGLQAAFFSGCNEDAIVCDPGQSGGGNTPLVLSWDGFTIGETYFFMLDGWSGDECDFEIDITDGSITPPPPDNANQPQGPTMVCPGAVVVYNIDDVFGAGSYIWSAPAGSSINGLGAGLTVDAPGGTMVTITFGSQGGNVCVQADNACNPPSANNCLPVTNQPIPVTIRDPLVVCYEDAPFIWDEDPFPILTSPGVFTLTSSPYNSYLGCDSLVRQTVTVKQIAPTNIGTKYVCAGDCYEINNEEFCDAGNYIVVFESFQGCDSAVTFALVVLTPEAVIPPPSNAIDCNSSGVVLTSTGSTPLGLASYQWNNASWNVVGGNATYNATLTGTYYLIVTMQGGGMQCRDTASVVVTGNTIPPGATATGGNINCLSQLTTLMSSSPTGGVTYSWAGPGINGGNQFQQNPIVNVPGTYIVTVRNPVNGCTSTATVTVLGDITPPAANAVGDTITCAQPSVTIDGSTNITTATWFWFGPGINAGNQTLENPNVIVSGTYSVTVTNTVNGCTNTTTTVVDLNNGLPTGNAGPNQTLTCTAPNTTLMGVGNGGGQPINFAWTGPNGFTSGIAQPSVNVAGTYILTVLNTLNGCSIKDTVQVAANQTVPTASAGADSTITCAQPSVTLIGSGSDTGPNFTATWSGPGINSGNSSQYNPTVDQQGDYSLLITNITNGCTATDSVVVNLNTSLPTANAGADDQLTCTTTTGITLNGSGVPVSVTFLWSGPGIGSNNDTVPNPTVTQPGTYILLVTNPVNGCTATDQVVVTQDANVPVAAGGPDHVLNCSVTIVDFDGSGSSSGLGIEYLWAGPGISGGNATAQSPTGLTLPGTYNLTVTNTLNNCVNTDVVVIQIDTIQPNADAGNPLILNCFNGSTDTLDASASSFGSDFTLLWAGPGINAGNQNSPNPIINGAPGLYTLTVTNTDNTCTATDQVNVTEDIIAPTADAGLDQTIDCVSTSASIGGNSSSGAIFTYLWTGPGIFPANQSLAMPIIAVPGTYTILVTNTVNGCTASNDVLVNTNAVYPTALAGNDGLLTCANPTATLDGSASSTGANFQVLWMGPDINAGNQNQVSPNVTVQGTYILAITNTINSCVTFDTVVVDENKLIPAANAGNDLVLNCQTTSTTLDGSFSDVGPTIIYLWTGSGINASNQNDQNPPIDQPGPYVLLVTDSANGCTSTDQVTVTQDNVDPAASAGIDMLITCANTTQTLDGSGSSTGAMITYVWQGPGINSNNVGLQNPTVDVSGTYTVTVINTQNFCTATDVVFVDENTNPPLTAAGPDRTLTCSDVTSQLDATLSASGPNISFLWDGPGIVPGDETSATPTVNTPGVYVLTITDAINGCTNVDAVNVGEDVLLPTVSAGNDLVITCANAGTGVTLSSAGSSAGPNFTILWSGLGITPANQNSPNPTVLLPDTYTLLITNTLNGCTQTDVAVVNADQNLPTANAGLDQVITCAAPNAVLDGTGSSSPSGSLIFLWNGPGINAGNQNGDMPTVLLSGTYSLTVTNSVTGCSATDQVVVDLDNLPAIVAASSEIITCQDQVSTVTVTTSLPGSIFLWEGPDVNQNNKDDQTLQVDVAGLYAVTVTAPNGCTTTTSTIVIEDQNVPQGNVEGSALNCLNSTTIISGEVVSPPGSTFAWTGPGIVGPVTTNSITVTQPGIYTFTISAPNGCVRPFFAEVLADFVEPVISAVATEQIDCNTMEVTINGAGSSVGPNFSYFWTTNTGHFVSGTNTLQPIVDRAGFYTLRVLNNLNGCESIDSIEVEVDPLVPSGFNVAVSNIRCFGDTNGSITVNGVQGGTPPFIFSLSGNTGSANNQYTGLSAGDYILSLEDANGCSLDTTISIGEPGQLSVELGPDIEVTLGEMATVGAQIQSTVGVNSINWNYSPGCDTLFPGSCETFTYLPLGTYRHTIEVEDVNGCIARDEIIVIVQKNGQVFVPNIFNPLSDLNFSVGVHVGIDVAKINYFNIFDRWGDQVFSLKEYIPTPGASPDAFQSWDGNVRGDKGQVGVYVWYCEVVFIDGQTKLFKGDVTLIR